MVRPRFWRSGSAQSSTNAIFQLGKWPWTKRWQVGPAGCSWPVRGRGVETDVREEKELKEGWSSMRSQPLLLALAGGAGSRTPAAWVKAPPKWR